MSRRVHPRVVDAVPYVSGPGAPVAGGGLLHPGAICAVALLLLNDHVLKAAFASWWTGKLSDVAGMIFFPLLLQGMVEVVQQLRGSWRPSRRVLSACALATGLVFAAVQVFPAATWLYRFGLGALQWPVHVLLAGEIVPLVAVACTPDPSDLLAVPFVLLPLTWRR